MTDEQRVKEVWPDAKVICGPENCNGHQIVLPISGDGWGAEFGAWADAASRLPEGESKRHDEVTADDEPEIFALLNLYRVNVEASSSPEAKQAFMDTMRFLLELAKVRHAAKIAPQTFEEWWNTEPVAGIWKTNHLGKQIAYAAWSAAKASSPATVPRDIAHTLWNEGGRLRTELAASLGVHPENWHKEGLQQRIAEWDKAAERYFDYAFSGTVSSPPVAGGESAPILTAENVCKLIDDLPKVLPEVARLMKNAVRKGECPHALRVSLRLKPLMCFVQEPLIKDVRGKE